MTDTIRPPHAISLWANKDILYVELPDATGEGKGVHLLRLPLNTFGLTKCVNILKERSEASRIGSRGDPTQYQADKAIKEMQSKAAGYTGPITKPKAKVVASPEQRSMIRDIMRKVGIA